ncbi:hypothetical protein [Endozoicomonas sp.]|uniref:hypothetical protein n=1 Tax=Endozoicomonas sp. TaxID=1892382 RepID=UPI0028886994|nr:hypothetical protein [Endozoicomonas sp.]
MPDSHLRHWINNEGPNSTYEHIKSELKNKSLSIEKLNFYFTYWIINITGFRAKDFSKSSIYLYLTQNVYKCIHTLQDITQQLADNGELNPMELFLKHRAEWLELSDNDLYCENQLAFGSLAALLYVYEAKRGKELYQAFLELAPDVKNGQYSKLTARRIY